MIPAHFDKKESVKGSAKDGPGWAVAAQMSSKFDQGHRSLFVGRDRHHARGVQVRQDNQDAIEQALRNQPNQPCDPSVASCL